RWKRSASRQSLRARWQELAELSQHRNRKPGHRSRASYRRDYRLTDPMTPVAAKPPTVPPAATAPTPTTTAVLECVAAGPAAAVPGAPPAAATPSVVAVPTVTT